MKRNIVIITGAASGIGLALGEAFARAGWDVLAADIRALPRKRFPNFYRVDVSHGPSVAKFARDALKKFPKVDCLINNAAVQKCATLVETSEKDWRQVLDTNVGSIFWTTKYFSQALRGGSILNVSSVHARATAKGMAAYAASKGAVSALTRAMAIELADQQTRVNSILPGAIETPMLLANIGAKGGAGWKKIQRSTPLGKIGQPSDIARLGLFLADPEAAGNITGQEFVCDGGVLARLASE